MRSVSVVIPAYNTPPGFLTQAVMSAVEQRPPPIEVIVVNDGSTTDLNVPSHPLVRVIQQPNRGANVARNLGIQAARGDLVGLLDHDDLWLPGKLAAQIPAMVDGVGMCSTDMQVIDGDGVVGAGWGGPIRSYESLLSGSSVALSSVLMDRLLVQRLGGFDASMGAAADWDMWLRIVKVSRAEHVPLPLVLYRHHESNMSRNYRRLYAQSLRVLWKHRGGFPLRGVRRQGQIYGAQAFDAYRKTRRRSDLLWSLALWPDYVARQLLKRATKKRKSRQIGSGANVPRR